MSEFVKVANVADFSDPSKKIIEVDDRYVVLVHVDGKFYCIDDICTHDGGPLGEGPLDAFHLSCPRHGAQFDIRSGKPLTMPATEPTAVHDVKIEDGEVWVRVND